MTDWNFADVWEAVADTVPDAPAAIHGERRLSWGETERRANGVARFLLDLGLRHQDKVAHYLYNGPEYMESTFAILKAGLVPVNTNYRYTDDELVYLWDNADAVVVIFHGTFTERIDGLRGRVPLVRAWLWVDDGNGACPPWATPYEGAVTAATDRVAPAWGRSGDDLYLLYTGGTTGMPKGVMWRQDDLFAKLNAGNLLRVTGGQPREPGDVAGLCSDGVDATGDHVVDSGGVDVDPVQQPAPAECAQVEGMHAGQRTVALTNGSAHSIDDIRLIAQRHFRLLLW